MSEERSIDGPRIERAVREVLLTIGEDLGRVCSKLPNASLTLTPTYSRA
jgi:hypothetical protein